MIGTVPIPIPRAYNGCKTGQQCRTDRATAAAAAGAACRGASPAALRRATRQCHQHALENALPLDVAQQRRPIASEQVRAKHKVQADAPANRHHAHQEFGGEAVPEGKAVFRYVWAEHGVDGGFEQRRQR